MFPRTAAGRSSSDDGSAAGVRATASAGRAERVGSRAGSTGELVRAIAVSPPERRAGSGADTASCDASADVARSGSTGDLVRATARGSAAGRAASAGCGASAGAGRAGSTGELVRATARGSAAGRAASAGCGASAGAGRAGSTGEFARAITRGSPPGRAASAGRGAVAGAGRAGSTGELVRAPRDSPECSAGSAGRATPRCSSAVGGCVTSPLVGVRAIAGPPPRRATSVGGSVLSGAGSREPRPSEAVSRRVRPGRTAQPGVSSAHRGVPWIQAEPPDAPRCPDGRSRSLAVDRSAPRRPACDPPLAATPCGRSSRPLRRPTARLPRGQRPAACESSWAESTAIPPHRRSPAQPPSEGPWRPGPRRGVGEAAPGRAVGARRDLQQAFCSSSACAPRLAAPGRRRDRGARRLPPGRRLREVLARQPAGPRRRRRAHRPGAGLWSRHGWTRRQRTASQPSSTCALSLAALARRTDRGARRLSPGRRLREVLARRPGEPRRRRRGHRPEAGSWSRDGWWRGQRTASQPSSTCAPRPLHWGVGRSGALAGWRRRVGDCAGCWLDVRSGFVRGDGCIGPWRARGLVTAGGAGNGRRLDARRLARNHPLRRGVGRRLAPGRRLREVRAQLPGDRRRRRVHRPGRLGLAGWTCAPRLRRRRTSGRSPVAVRSAAARSVDRRRPPIDRPGAGSWSRHGRKRGPRKVSHRLSASVPSLAALTRVTARGARRLSAGRRRREVLELRRRPGGAGSWSCHAWTRGQRWGDRWAGRSRPASPRRRPRTPDRLSAACGTSAADSIAVPPEEAALSRAAVPQRERLKASRRSSTCARQLAAPEPRTVLGARRLPPGRRLRGVPARRPAELRWRRGATGSWSRRGWTRGQPWGGRRAGRSRSRRRAGGRGHRIAFRPLALGLGPRGRGRSGCRIRVASVFAPRRAARSVCVLAVGPGCSGSRAGRGGVVVGRGGGPGGSLAGARERRLVSAGPCAVDRCSRPGPASVRGESADGRSGAGCRGRTGSGFNRRATVGGDPASSDRTGACGAARFGSSAGDGDGAAAEGSGTSGAVGAGPSSTRPRRTPPGRAARAALRGGAEGREGAPAG